ncbi:Hypothetical protein PP7435_CHR1-2280 [Komagataella phaffii CBS 7435]|uniref:Uncharacterized protein n=1 Tax=Komagataella phaffii (strain ATCC 76273 / CBS 7435 / CECT 11047 / NRRL Y-11430 / Wegner 21-1) TaxID=981350 RepID=A0A1G4KP98_KOMPC|nr:Hypothetical protein BQ9382_C1-3408 [Komagataella phaffii CBS 7435]SCV11832.1 Hypothetical protein PP7435_CHR1-2280 [Komagataella phaffii CBS 7435]
MFSKQPSTTAVDKALFGAEKEKQIMTEIRNAQQSNQRKVAYESSFLGDFISFAFRSKE